jgi:hypothetical protein
MASNFEQATGVRVDGVLSFDPYALADLLRFTGPIHVTGLAEPLTSDNAAEYLLHGQYLGVDFQSKPSEQAREDKLAAASHATFSALLNAPELPSPRTVIDVLSPDVAGGRLKMYGMRPAEERFFTRHGLDGAFPRPDRGDLIGLMTQNAALNKIDYYLHRSLRYQASFDPTSGRTRAVATVRLRNDAPRSGLPYYVIGSPPRRGVTPGTNRSWISIYSPLWADRVSVGGKPVEVQAQRELGLNVFSFYAEIPSHSTVEVQVHLSGTLPTTSTYRLRVTLQPVVHPDALEVDLSAPDGWQVSGGSPSEAPAHTETSRAEETRLWRLSRTSGD